jgi:hypothetical protein
VPPSTRHRSFWNQGKVSSFRGDKGRYHTQKQERGRSIFAWLRSNPSPASNLSSKGTPSATGLWSQPHDLVAITLWNTVYLICAVAELRTQRRTFAQQLLAHIGLLDLHLNRRHALLGGEGGVGKCKHLVSHKFFPSLWLCEDRSVTIQQNRDFQSWQSATWMAG